MPVSRLQDLYDRLLDYFGPQQWWPGDTPFEVIVGAVLTQNTNWGNVEKAIDNLKNAGLLSLEALYTLPHETLADKIRPCGYYNLKATRLKNLLHLLHDVYEADLDFFFAGELHSLRQSLLSVKGIGPETADSILLYAAQKPIFVVDAYTHRILSRHAFITEEDSDYSTIQDLFMDSLPNEPALFNEFHALIVMTGKHFCKKTTPLCETCPLKGF